jgi:protein SCO1/2
MKFLNSIRVGTACLRARLSNIAPVALQASRDRKRAVSVALLCASLALHAHAQDLLNMKGVDRPAPLQHIGIDQKLTSQVPLDLQFKDETGRTVKLGEFFGKRPVILAPVYYECPMLCTQILNGLVRSLKAVTFNPGEEFEVVVFSFDARDTTALAAEKKQNYLRRYDRKGTDAGWHFLTGDPNAIKALTNAIGFRFVWDAHTNQFAHASGVMLLTPQGRLSKYFYGIEYAPKDVRLGLIEAAQNKIGTPVDQLLLFCFHWDSTTGKYTAAAMNVLRLAGGTTILLLGGFVIIMLRRDVKQKGKRASFSARPTDA